MKRAVVGAIVLVLMCALSAAAQQQAYRVGFIYPGTKQLTAVEDVLRRALADAGYVEGRDL